ncbi:MAG: hypothetical protein ACKV1O_05430, partial [Saprospiraceae bacterium]
MKVKAVMRQVIYPLTSPYFLFLRQNYKALTMQRKPLIECVPNFSEGRSPEVIRQITDAIAAVEGVRL